MTEQQTFDQWCIVELFGRQVIAGQVTEQVIGGCSFIRVYVPETEKQPAFTRFYGQGAIYAMTPVSEEVARVALKRFSPAPVNVYVPELQSLLPSPQKDPGPAWDEEKDDHDYYDEDGVDDPFDEDDDEPYF
jgi:hypothetical protein